MRRLRKGEILWTLGWAPEGLTWADLVRNFPRKTLDRHLKTLIKDGFIEKLPEKRKHGERGRQSTRYRIPSRFWMSWGCFVVHWPGKKIGPRFFLGELRTNPHNVSKKHVHLFPKEAKEYREYLKNLKKGRVKGDKLEVGK